MKSLIKVAFADIISRGGKVSARRVFACLVFNMADSVLPTFRLINYLIDKNTFIARFFLLFLRWKYMRVTDRLNVFMPVNTDIGIGVQFPHNFPIVINPEAKIGRNVTIHPCTLIGRHRGKKGAPIIGDNVFIGHGTKIVGNPVIGDWCFISPAAVITKDIPSDSVVGAGVNNILFKEGGINYVKMYL